MGKNIIIKEFNNNTFEELFPKTISTQIPDLNDAVSNIINTQNISKIFTGSYMGTGEYGAGSPNSLTFPFVPKYFQLIGYSNDKYPWIPIVSYSDYGSCAHLACSILSQEYEPSKGFFSGYANGSVHPNRDYAYAKLVNTTLSWYYNNNTGALGPNWQFNILNALYYYIALG